MFSESSVRLGAAATAILFKLQKGIPPWVPLKGHEKKTYKQLQEEAVESKRRDLAVLEANDGIWPGVRTPSHALFLWASGSELTTILEADHMPNKFIPKHMRSYQNSFTLFSFSWDDKLATFFYATLILVLDGLLWMHMCVICAIMAFSY